MPRPGSISSGQRRHLFSRTPNLRGHLTLTGRKPVETDMDKSIWIAAGALTAWLMIGAAAIM